jgi:hypothetical protein
MSLSALGLFGLFLKPIRERVTANAKDALVGQSHENIILKLLSFNLEDAYEKNSFG